MPNAPIDTTAAESYEQHLVPGMFRHFAERVVDLANPQPGERVLDLACGTGIGARLAARRIGEPAAVAGLDLDAAMLSVAARLARDMGAAIDWHCANALTMPFADHSFDLCLCLQGLQFLPDRVAGFAEIRRVLEPRGRLCATMWAPLEYNLGHQALVRALENQGADAAPARRPCSFSNADEIRDAARSAGFRSIDLHAEDGVSDFASIDSFLEGITVGAPSTRHAVARLSQDGRSAFAADVIALLQPYLASGRLAYPMRTFILIARP